MASMLTNFLMPTTLGALTPSASNAASKSTSTRARVASTSSSDDSTSSSSSSSSASSLGTTFLSLLAQELQNQDPTAPVDATQMVGQMISLNQLEQLISINEALNPSTTSSSTSSSQATKSEAANSALGSTTGSATDKLSPSAASAATSQLPFDPNTMLPLGFANSGAAAASINSYLNPVTMGTFGTTSNATGGK